MRRHKVNALLVTAAAGASALLVIAASAAATAQPATTPSSPTVTSSQAGYVTLGTHFRFVTTTVQVPPAASYVHYAEVVLGGPSVTPATLGVRAGGGVGSVEWDVVGPLGGMGGGTSAPKSSVRLWGLTKSGVTTYNGVRGSMRGPWTTKEVIDVAADGRVVMSPLFLWNNGRNFGAWLQASS